MRAVALGVFLCLAAIAAHAETPPAPQAKSIAKDVWLIPGGFLPDRQPDGNTVIFDGPKGLIVMDTGRHLWQRQAILDFAKAHHKPIAAIVNSHWHLDHVSGNPDLKRAYPGAKVFASNAIDDALTGFLARSAKGAEDYLKSGDVPADTAEDIRNDIATWKNGAALKPDVVVSKSATRTIAGKSLQVNLAPNAATDGDVWVYDPASKVVATGDLVTLPAPFLDTACPKGWSDALGKVEATPFVTAIPGHGAPMTRADIATYHKAFDAFIACAASDRDAKECAEGWAKDAGALLGSDEATQKKAKGMAMYYAKDVLRAHGGKSAECKA
ncbi:MAG: MBL fold metallo-hydrolase [Alphaproteobacteria bacterium]|nr:MBL fold metallo-hydrolase [Alphaproteobacteria bacterium]